jgi:flagellar basal-body rod protein FlgB
VSGVRKDAKGAIRKCHPSSVICTLSSDNWYRFCFNLLKYLATAFINGGNHNVPIDKVFSDTIANLTKSLNLRSIQHKALASNIANMDTPNYKAVELDVAEKMNKNKGSGPGLNLARTHGGHLPFRSHRTDRLKLKAVPPSAYSLRGDGNTVDIDRTMGKLAENTLMYRATAQLISRKFKGLKNVIKGGK